MEHFLVSNAWIRKLYSFCFQHTVVYEQDHKNIFEDSILRLVPILNLFFSAKPYSIYRYIHLLNLHYL